MITTASDIKYNDFNFFSCSSLVKRLSDKIHTTENAWINSGGCVDEFYSTFRKFHYVFFHEDFSSLIKVDEIDGRLKFCREPFHVFVLWFENSLPVFEDRSDGKRRKTVMDLSLLLCSYLYIFYSSVIDDFFNLSPEKSEELGFKPHALKNTVLDLLWKHDVGSALHRQFLNCH